ncbi:MAG: hypothetical protein DRG55_01255 [Deltaproteobacteria bacterium]|nr:MAG: hypothetical protein DRG69_03415 [Deltaproteobacteria bacterium]RLB03049.1 MAG: hypothetical protein DRG55_01255 [Deltaproteobacteria bacterium]
MMRFLMIALALFLVAAAVPEGGKGPVHVTSERMQADYAKGVIVFSGDVVAKRGDFRLESRQLRVYLSTGEGVEKRDVERIEAEGEVKIAYGTKRALCERAIYYVKEERVVLEGHPLLWEGDNRLRGWRIVVFLKEDRAIAEGKGQERVELTIVEERREGKLLPRP